MEQQSRHALWSKVPPRSTQGLNVALVRSANVIAARCAAKRGGREPSFERKEPGTTVSFARVDRRLLPTTNTKALNTIGAIERQRSDNDKGIAVKKRGSCPVRVPDRREKCLASRTYVQPSSHDRRAGARLQVERARR